MRRVHIAPATRRPRKARPSKARDGIHPVDKHVGERVRLRRILLGMSQETLADGLGLTFQQVQKYERGANRVSASRLYDMGRVLDVPVSFFFDGMDGEAPPADESPMKRKTLELVRHYHNIGNDAVRERVFEVVKRLAAVVPG